MSINSLLTANLVTPGMPKLATALKNGGSVDATTLLKENGKLGSAETSKAGSMDILELSAKNSGGPAEKKGNVQVRDSLLNDAIKLANYVKERNEEIRGGVEKPIPPEIVQAFYDTAPNKESLERSRKIGELLRPITAKLDSGKKITGEEMSILQKYAPEVAAVAKRVEAEREQFSRQLKSAGTQEEKDRLIMMVKSQIASAGKKDPGYALAMMAAVDEAIKEDREGHNNGASGFTIVT